MITYNRNVKGNTICNVLLEGKKVGHIQRDRASGWFYYKPKGGVRGELMGTVHEVKMSIEEP